MKYWQFNAKVTPQEFEEEIEVVAEPYLNGDYPHGLHTRSAAGSVTLLDGKYIPFHSRVLERLLRRRFTETT
jgi:hypothetical protein